LGNGAQDVGKLNQKSETLHQARQGRGLNVGRSGGRGAIAGRGSLQKLAALLPFYADRLDADPQTGLGGFEGRAQSLDARGRIMVRNTRGDVFPAVGGQFGVADPVRLGIPHQGITLGSLNVGVVFVPVDLDRDVGPVGLP
jgi:hypothetical protein